MGFFFTRNKGKARATVAPIQRAGSRATKESLNRMGCKCCPLDKVANCRPKMKPDLADKTDVYFLGQQPEEADDQKGSFESRNGRLLRSVVGYNVCRSSFDYVIRDYDAERVQPPWVAMECCRSLVTASIEQARPKVIVGLGVLPLQWMLNSSDMVGLRGRIFSVRVGNHSCYYIPTYDVGFIVNEAFNKDEPLRSKLGACLKFDLKRAFEAVDWNPPEIEPPEAARAGIQVFTGHGAGQLPAVLKLIGEAAEARTRAIDLETSHLRPYADGAVVLTCALSYGGVNFAFALDHPTAGWTDSEKKIIKQELKECLAREGKIVAHNAPFECEWLIHLLGKECIYHDTWECTMMQAHFLDERRGRRGGNDEQFQPNPYQALDFLIRMYFGLSYKSLFKLDRKNMLNANLEETLVYNAADTKYTLRLHKLQIRRLLDHGLLEAYHEAVERQPTVALMQSIGIQIDQAVNEQGREGLEAVVSLIDHEISETPEVKKYQHDTRRKFNVDSHPELITVLKDYLKVGKELVNDVGKETTDKGTLAKIAHPFAKLVEDHRNSQKLKSTYFDPFRMGSGVCWSDGRIHPSFNTTFAETGRTSSDEPNQQNWPSRSDKWVRKQVRAPKGFVLVAFDYGQLEACTAAMCTKDKVLVKAMWEDYDIHMEWAIKAAHRYPAFINGLHNLKDKDVMKGFRSLIKNKLVFPVFFGATNKSVAGYLDAPQEPVDKLMDEFWRTFYGVHNWQTELMRGYYNTGFVSSPTGRRRHYPLTKNQAVNYPIQSVACDIVCRAMVHLSSMAADTGNWWLHPVMNIHDDLTFCIPDHSKILEESIEIIYRTMLSPPYKFVNVPLSVSCSIGENWLDMQDVGKFWSHKDLK